MTTMNGRTITITLNDEQMEKFQRVHANRADRSTGEVFEQVVERGLYDLNYRDKRNKQEWAEKKEFREWKKSQQQ